MNYDRLKTFITVYEHRSFSDAAKVLFVSQPTITAQIKALEQEVDVKLFERTTQKIEPTEPANVLYKFAKNIIRLTEIAQKEIRAMKDIPHDNLTIGASMTIGEYILPNFLKEFKDQFPLVQINTQITNSENIITLIKNRQIDIGFIESPLEAKGMIIEPILEDELVLITPKEYQFHNERTVTMEELKQIPLIVREKGSGTREVMESYLENAGLDVDALQIVMELGSTQSIKSAVEAGLGVAFISRHVISKELKLKLFKEKQLENMSMNRSLYSVYHQDHVLKTAAELFLEQIVEYTSINLASNLIKLPVLSH